MAWPADVHVGGHAGQASPDGLASALSFSEEDALLPVRAEQNVETARVSRISHPLLLLLLHHS